MYEHPKPDRPRSARDFGIGILTFQFENRIPSVFLGRDTPSQLLPLLSPVKYIFLYYFTTVNTKYQNIAREYRSDIPIAISIRSDPIQGISHGSAPIHNPAYILILALQHQHQVLSLELYIVL